MPVIDFIKLKMIIFHSKSIDLRKIIKTTLRKCRPRESTGSFRNLKETKQIWKMLVKFDLVPKTAQKSALMF